LFACALLAVHGILLAASIPRNSVTINEVMHLPTGIAYWERGEFWGYHHNPPLVRLLFSIPGVVTQVPTDYTHYQYDPYSRKADIDLGRDFMLLNRERYMAIFVMCRLVVAGLSVGGGYVAWRWSREVFGNAGGLITLCLWTFSPNLLAHAGLVTPDVGAMVVGFLATYCFWKYLKSPSLPRAVLAAILLGLAEASKFSLVVLVPVWIVLAVVKWWNGAGGQESLTARRGLLHGFVVLVVSLTVLNDVYLCEGTGKSLGSFDFRSRALTHIEPGNQGRLDWWNARVNIFRGTVFGRLPVPLPEHYVLGVDDQMFDIDTGHYLKYLRGDLRRDEGWWYYYLYAFAVKTPVGTIVLLGTAFAAALLKKSLRADAVTEVTLLLTILAFFVFVSSQTGMNSHSRYLLPAYPFLFVYAGRLGRWLSSSWGAFAFIAVLLVANGVSVARIHPHYLAYFNEVAGGPERALDHLADSNIDWGQGLIALKDWVEEHQNGRPLYLAYFGTMFPEVIGIDYTLPPLGPPAYPERVIERKQPEAVGPVPGLHAVSANFLIGLRFSAPNGTGGQRIIPFRSYTYYREFTPVATPGYSIYVYDITLADANRVRKKLGLPLLTHDNQPADSPKR
jgi:hypothetical protein